MNCRQMKATGMEIMVKDKATVMAMAADGIEEMEIKHINSEPCQSCHSEGI